jgi:hypothetical protein
MTIEFRNYIRLLREKVNLMPTITKNELFHMADLVWWEEWSPATTDSPRECIGGGWQCSECGIDLGSYMTHHCGERCYFDKYEERPTIEFCPCCGRKFNKIVDF